MKRRGSFSVFIFFLLAGSLALAYKGPEIQFDKEVWHFGQNKQGEILIHVFTFTNGGDAPLKIKQVRTSCGCAAALVSKKEIEPGEKGEIKVTFNTKGYGGNVAKYVFVESNDPEQPNKQLTVQASIEIPPRPQINLDRYSVDMGLILESEDIQTQTRIKNEGELELNVEFSHNNASFFVGGKKIDSQLKIPAGKEVEVKMEITPRSNVGLIREYVLFKTNDPMRPNLSFYVSGYIVTKHQLKELFDKYQDKLK